MPLSSLNPLANPAPFHILTYGTLLGTNFFQSFIGGIVAYRALPRPSFASLQTAIFPIYFSLQTLLPAALIFTWPAPRGTNIPNGYTGVASGESGVRSALIGMVFLGLLNWVVVGPMVTSVMRERKHRETKDGKRYFDKGEQSKEMKELNWRFGVLHSISSLLNIVHVGVSVWYGVWLSERL